MGFGSLARMVARLVFTQRLRFLVRGLKGVGRVVDRDVSSTGPERRKHDTMQAPVVKVLDVPTGTRVRFRSSVAITSTSVRVGDEVPVRYLPGQPDQAEIDQPMAMWFFPLGAAAIGTILLAVWWYAPR